MNNVWTKIPCLYRAQLPKSGWICICPVTEMRLWCYTCLEQGGLWVDGGDRPDALYDDGIANGVGCIGSLHGVQHNIVHILAGRLISGPKKPQNR